MDYIENDHEQEIWKRVKFPLVVEDNYEISNYGRIKNIKTGNILITYQHPITAYHTIKLKYYNYDRSIRYKNFYIHKLVGWEFCNHDDDSSKPFDHINGNKRDNYYKNLEQVTHGENTRRAFNNGLINIYCENNHSNKYKESFVMGICELFEEGYLKKDILKMVTDDKNATARKYSSLYSLIVHLHYKDRFTHICNKYKYKPLSKIKESDNFIVDLINKGYENIEIMNEYGYQHVSDNEALYNKIMSIRKELMLIK